MTRRETTDRPWRLVIWGPGEVGGSTLRAAHADPRFEIVGVKVFSPHKAGRDAGEVVGIDPIGVTTTTSKEEILALDADCVIVTPLPRTIMSGLDDDVVDLLESGKSVVTTAAYHNVAQRNWLNSATTPSARLRTLAGIKGAAQSRAEEVQLAVGRLLTAVPALDVLTDPILRKAVDTVSPPRATPQRLIDACRRGNSVLHGTGVHPTYMVERQVAQLARLVPDVQHIRFLEAIDFGLAQEGMWGGLRMWGFGEDPSEIDSESLLAYAGDFYYRDLVSNVGHEIFGLDPEDIRFERSLRGIPARSDIHVGGIDVRAGQVGALHLRHSGYLPDGRCFFTNEECWYLTPENATYGDEGLPYDTMPRHGGHAYEIRGANSRLSGQISGTLRSVSDNAVTGASVQVMLAAVEAVCTSEPGILIDEAIPSYTLVEEATA